MDAFAVFYFAYMYLLISRGNQTESFHNFYLVFAWYKFVYLS